ncbi:MAG: hypothetical protein ACPHL6_04360 [Rubripirellula sp.]
MPRVLLKDPSPFDSSLPEETALKTEDFYEDNLASTREAKVVDNSPGHFDIVFKKTKLRRHKAEDRYATNPSPS